MKCKIFILMFFLFASQAFASGPVAHMYFAQKWLEAKESYSLQEKNSFIRGALFPDIRYLGTISRKETHCQNITLQNIINDKEPFSKGKKFHSFIDEKREELAIKWKIYKQFKGVPGQKYIITFLKLLEDEVIYYKIPNWVDARNALATIDPAEISSKITKSAVKKWHSILMPSFCMPPSQYLNLQIKRNKILLKAPIPIDVLKTWVKILPELAKDKKTQNYVNNLIEEIDKMFIASP